MKGNYNSPGYEDTRATLFQHISTWVYTIIVVKTVNMINYNGNKKQNIIYT